MKLGEMVKRGSFAQGVIGLGLAVAHSYRARGGRRTAIFSTLGLALPYAAEFVGINIFKALRHHSQPQVANVPLSTILGWHNITYATYAMVESVLADTPPPDRRWAYPLATAAVATSLDLVLDCYGLDQGLWEWQGDGPYAQEIVGPNGKRGIPLLNYVGWLQLTSTVTALYQQLAVPLDEAPGNAGSAEAGRNAALLVLPFYLGAAVWAITAGKPQYLLYSALFPATLLAALTKREQQWLALSLGLALSANVCYNAANHFERLTYE